MITLEESQEYCRKVAKSRAKNFYYSFVLLTPERRNAMCAVYAFMRYCDDLSDEPGATRAAMDKWREALESALAGKPDSSPVWPAFLDAVNQYRIPHKYFQEMIDGVASDLESHTFETFDQLYQYCYRVASVVGLTTVHIFGFDSPELVLPLAEKCGIAFQLTNIIRDIKEDAGLGRVYLPTEDLRRFAVSPDDLASGHRTESVARLIDFEIQRAKSYYDQSAALPDLIHEQSRSSLRALIGIYSDLLDKIAESPLDVLQRRISLGLAEKLAVVLKSTF